MSKTHVIDGKTFVEVERPANDGDKVIIVNAWDAHDMYANGDIITADRVCERGIFNDKVSTEGNTGGYIASREYRVLEAVDQAPESTADIIANLVRRVASLEAQLRDTQANVERQGVEIGEVQYLAKTAYDEITEHTAPTPCEDAPKVATSEPQVFDLAKIKSFKLSDLAGKTLRVHSATDTAEGISVTTTVAIDEFDGKMYVLESEVIR